jgi:hypothetical protein
MHAVLRNTVRNIALAVAATLLTVLAAELVLRLVHTPPRIHSGWGWEESPRRQLAHFDHDAPNQLGTRGQRIAYGPNDYVVVLLGDSQAEAATSAPENMPERLLEAALSLRLHRQVKVHTLAVSAWGQDQQLLALERYLRTYRADLVLLWPTPGNDFFENAWADRSVQVEAGHLKPTYRLGGDGSLEGPFYRTDGYYRNSAILQLIAMARQKGRPLEQTIFAEWESRLPAPYAIGSVPAAACAAATAIDQGDFYIQKAASEFAPDQHYLLLTAEDFPNSRSHFCPNMIDRSPRDSYLVRLTTALYARLKATAEAKGAGFLVFYPVRADIDQRSLLITCIQKYGLPGSAMPWSVDYAARLRETVPAENLLLFDLPGGDELRVPGDGHLSDLGNRRAMDLLASLLPDRTGSL